MQFSPQGHGRGVTAVTRRGDDLPTPYKGGPRATVTPRPLPPSSSLLVTPVTSCPTAAFMGIVGSLSCVRYLMFVCLQKDAKQCCDGRNLDRTHCAGRCHAQHNEYDQALYHHNNVWQLFGDKQTSKSSSCIIWHYIVANQ